MLQFRQALPASVTGIWVLVAASLVTHWWLNAVAARAFPPLPETLQLWLSNWYGAKDAFEVRDVTALFGFAVATMIVSLLTWLALWLWRRIKKR